MATYPCIITWGQSNSEGIAPLISATDDDMNRWFGATVTDLVAQSYPKTSTMPGLKQWTCRMPYNSGRITGTATAGTTSSIIKDSTAPFASAAKKVIILTRNTGHGEMRYIDSVNGGNNEATVGPIAFIATPDTTTQYLVCDGAIADNVPSTTVLTATSYSPGWTVNTFATGNQVLCCVTGANVGQMRPIVSNTASTITVSPAFDNSITVYDGYVVYNAGTRSIATYTGTFADRKILVDQSIVYTDGYEYNTHLSLPHWSPTGSPFYTNPGMELGWRMLTKFGKKLYHIHLAIPAATMTPNFTTPTNSDFSWFHKLLHNDWHPGSVNTDGSDDLYGVLVNTILPAAVTAMGSDTLDVVGIFANEGEGDAAYDGRYQFAGASMKLIRDRMRQAIEDAGMTQRSAGKIPFIIGGMTLDTWAYASDVISQFETLAQDDPYTGYVDASEFSSSVGHFDTPGMLAFGQAFYDKWLEILTRDSDATSPETTRWSLAQIRAEVKSRYEGNSVNTDSTDARINRAINDAQRSIVNRLGHAAWFLRRTETMSVTADQYTPFTMPAVVGNLLQIRDSTQPHRELKFNMIGHTAEGRIQIVMPWADQSASSVIVDFMARLLDLSGDGDYTPIPYEYIELLVLEAVARLAERGGNISLAASCKSSAAEQWAGVWRRVNAQDRSRNSTWHVDPDGTKNRSWNVHDGAWGWGMI